MSQPLGNWLSYLQPEIYPLCLNSCLQAILSQVGLFFLKCVCVCMYGVYVLAWKLPNPIMDF